MFVDFLDFIVYVVVVVVCIYCIGGDCYVFDYRMRVVMYDVVVFEGFWFVFICIVDNVFVIRKGVWYE